MDQTVNRREFLRWVGASSLIGALPLAGCNVGRPHRAVFSEPALAKNVFHLEQAAARALGADASAYLSGGADDMRTLRANCEAFTRIQIRARRLVDVRSIDTKIEFLGERLESPILLAPVGFQGFFHPEGEIATARAAHTRQHRMIVSSVSNFSVGEIAEAGGPVWFQLYPTTNRAVTRGLLRRAEDAGCRVLALTVDTPVLGNRERHSTTLARLLTAGEMRMGNYEGLEEYDALDDAGMTWDMVGWLRANTKMKIVLKGIVTREDASLAVDHGVDAVLVSNHGGRQLESDRATIDCLEEVVQAIGGRMPVMIDGGFRRGTDVFKAIALGARAVCIGRPFCWGLGAFGQAGVEQALELLQAELVRAMQLAGTPSIRAITRDFCTTAS